MRKNVVSHVVAGISAAICLSLMSVSAHANGEPLLLEGGEAALISTIDTFKISVIDQLTDGCLAKNYSLALRAICRRD